MKTLICNCNQTMPLDGPALSKALASSAPLTVHSTLCRRQAPEFQRAAKSGDDLLVACTQESRLFLELNEQTVGAPALAERPIRFVNIRETAGWSKDASAAMPKIAALLAAAQLPDPEPVATVTYRSQGRCLVTGSPDATERAAGLLAGAGLQISLLVQGAGALAQRREHVVHSGQLNKLSGWLGQFEAVWTSSNPIDLDLCTRCNACIDVCPEGAIDFGYQVDLARCKSHRDCVRVCEAAGAIDFGRAPLQTTEVFDLVLDLRAQPAFTQHALPQGYFHGGSDAQKLFDAAMQLRGLVGEFDKPKFFNYNAKICAHSRNEQVGCKACIDVCSASAISSDSSLKGKLGGKSHGMKPASPTAGGQGGGIVVNPNLCVGCGACTTVCPTGALAFATPGTVDQGRVLRTLLSTYQRAGGRDAALLLHSQGAGARALEDLGRASRTDRSFKGLPARVLPLALWHTASVGIDLWLAALASGASQVWVLLTDEEAPDYRRVLAEQMAVAQALLTGLGYSGSHLRLLTLRDARDLPELDRALQAPPARSVQRAATFAPQAEKRATLELALDHLLQQSPLQAASSQAAPSQAAPSQAAASRTATSQTATSQTAPASSASSARTQGQPAMPEVLPLPAAGSPWGSLQVNTDSCTLCLACVGACPSAALADNPDKPQLRFIEKNCVQCGLCVKTCPEDAITLQPRMWLADGGKARRQLRVLNEAQPFACIRCSKPFGTLQGVQAMVAKLAGHAMFQGAAAERLKMCSDCRVIDIHTNPGEVRITDL